MLFNIDFFYFIQLKQLHNLSLNFKVMTDIVFSKPLSVYACLYIKQVRQNGYTKSFKSFVQKYPDINGTDLLKAWQFDRLLRQKGFIVRSNRVTYHWNTEGKILLVADIIRIVENL